MKDRIQVNDLTQAKLTPDAKPVDTYFRPQEEAVQQSGDTGLQQLIEGLGKIRPQLMEIGGQYLDKQAKVDTSEGNEAFRTALLQDQDLNKKSWKELVDKGVVPAGASPWFQKGWREQQLRGMGEDYGRDLMLNWNANGDVKNSDDPTKLNQFLADQQSAFRDKVKASGIEYRPSELTEVLDPVLDHYNHAVGQQQTAFRITEREKEVETGTRVEVSKLASRLDLPVEDRAARIQAVVDDMYNKGLSGSKSRQIMAEAVIDSATTAKDPSMLGLLNQLKTGNAVVGADPMVKTKMAQATESIEERHRNDQRWTWTTDDRKYHDEVTKPRADTSWQWSIQQHAWALDQHDRTEQEKSLNGALGDAIMKDPTQDIRQTPEFKELQRLDPMKAANIMHYQQVYIGGGEGSKSDDPNSVYQITRDLYTGFTPPMEIKGRLMNSFTHGLVTRQTFERLQAEVLQVQQGAKDPILGSKEMSSLTDGVYKGIVKDVNGQFGETAVKASMGAAEFHDWARKWTADPTHKDQGISQFRADAEAKAVEIVTAYNSMANPADMGKSKPGSPPQFPKPQGGYPMPPPGAVLLLQQQPWTYAQFDQRYGPGKASELLQGTKKGP